MLTMYGNPSLSAALGKIIPTITQKLQNNSSNNFDIDRLIQQNLINNPYAQRAGDWFTKVLDSNYQAYSPEYKKQLYTTRANQLIEDVFKPQEERFAARLATSGLSGSGVAADMWANEVMKGQNRILADLMSEIEQENLNLTRADQAQALSMFPALSSLGDVLTYRGILSEDEYQNRMYELQKKGQLFDQDYRTQLLELQRLAQEFERQMASEQFKYQKKKDTATGLGKLLGGIAGFIIGGPGGAAAGGGIGGLLDKIFS